MRKLKAVVLSDIHLGEEETLLCRRDQYNITEITVERIRALSRAQAPFEDGIEQVILIGT